MRVFPSIIVTILKPRISDGTVRIQRNKGCHVHQIAVLPLSDTYVDIACAGVGRQGWYLNFGENFIRFCSGETGAKEKLIQGQRPFAGKAVHDNLCAISHQRWGQVNLFAKVNIQIAFVWK